MVGLTRDSGLWVGLGDTGQAGRRALSPSGSAFLIQAGLVDGGAMGSESSGRLLPRPAPHSVAITLAWLSGDSGALHEAGLYLDSRSSRSPRPLLPMLPE